MTFLLASHQSTFVPEKHRKWVFFTTIKENRNVVLFCNTAKLKKYSSHFKLVINPSHLLHHLFFPTSRAAPSNRGCGRVGGREQFEKRGKACR